jgi:hypothetical protein
MVFSLSRSALLVAAGAAALTWTGCGGGSPAAPNPTPAATPTPAPNPTPTATPDPQANLAPGPVSRWQIKVRSIAPEKGTIWLRPKEQDPDGAWVVCRGDFVVFDGNQANAQGQECRWNNSPVYHVSDPDGVFDLENSSNPFLLRTNIVAVGDVRVRSTLDGIESNELVLRAKKSGCPAAYEPITAADRAALFE